MKRSKRVETTERKHEVWIVRRVGNNTRGYCSRCDAQVEMLTTDEAAEALQTTADAIRAGIAAGEAHVAWESDDTSLVCWNSLARGY